MVKKTYFVFVILSILLLGWFAYVDITGDYQLIFSITGAIGATVFTMGLAGFQIVYLLTSFGLIKWLPAALREKNKTSVILCILGLLTALAYVIKIALALFS